MMVYQSGGAATVLGLIMVRHIMSSSFGAEGNGVGRLIWAHEISNESMRL